MIIISHILFSVNGLGFVFSAVLFFTQSVQHFQEIRRQRTGKRHALAANRMEKPDFRRMKQLAVKGEFLVFVSVSFIAHNGVPQIFGVHPYLVGSARL